MPQQSSEDRRVKGYCGLCIARCGSIATVEGGRFTRLDPDPSHPTGAALCAKGRAAPELVYSKDRLTRPLRRTRPKGDADPGWEPISWEGALDAIVATCAASQTRMGRTRSPSASPRIDHRHYRLGPVRATPDECIRDAKPGLGPRTLRLGARLRDPLRLRCGKCRHRQRRRRHA